MRTTEEVASESTTPVVTMYENNNPHIQNQNQPKVEVIGPSFCEGFSENLAQLIIC